MDGQQMVLYSKDVADESLPSPNGKIITEAISLYLKKFNLTVQVDCDAKDVQPACESSVQGKNILEGLKVTIRQKEGVITSQSPTKQIVIKTSFNEKSMFKSTAGDKNDVRVYFSPTKTMFQSTTSVQQSEVRTKAEASKSKSTHNKTKIPVKMFAQSVRTNYLEEAKFVELVQMIKQYEIEVEGENIKQSKTVLNVEDILDASCPEQAVIVSTRVERSDVQKCYVRVCVGGECTRDAMIKIQRDQ